MKEIKFDTFSILYEILGNISKTIPRRINPLAQSEMSLNIAEPFSTITETFMNIRQNKLDKFLWKN